MTESDYKYLQERLSKKPHTTFGLIGSVAKITESLC